MILQEVLIGKNEYEELYFRIKGTFLREGNTLGLLKNTVFSTDTYYNSFSIGKWKKYCNIDKMQLNITIQGEAAVIIAHSALDERNELQTNVILKRNVSAAKRKKITIDLPEISKGTIYFKIKSLSNKTLFYGAEYIAGCVREKDIMIALNICTFRRDGILLRNLELLKNEFLQNKASPLYGHLKIFIVDNGRTLDIERLAEPDIYVYYNQNIGGAGGFSKGLLEISRKKEKEHITNVIFMDDDIDILPEALIRTYRMLRILKEEYESAFLAGAILRQDYGYVQSENSACWNGGKIVLLNHGLDLRQYKNVVYNEVEKENEYGAWCYCCVPAKIVSPDNLAMPVFIHFDDVEYSLRNTDKIITLNGIAVGHPTSGQRAESSNVYYDLRNMLIIDAKYYQNYGKTEVKKEIRRRMLDAYFHYRYKDIKLIYKAIEDFCNGPNWLMQIDAALYHMKIKEMGYQFEDVSEIVGKEIPFYIQEDNLITDYFGKKAKRWTIKKIMKLAIIVITLNGAYLPHKKTMAFGMNISPAKLFCRSKIISFDPKSMQGFYLKRDIMKIFTVVDLYMKACRIIDKKYETSCKDYERLWEELHGRKYWERVMG